MARAVPLTREQLTQIETLFSAGVTQREIASRLGLHYNTVWQHVHDPNFRIKLEDVRAATKRVHAVKIREHAEKLHDAIGGALDSNDLFKVKAGTGALKDMDQIQAVACGDEAQAGVPAAVAPVDLKVLIAQLAGSQQSQPSLPA
ncbi:MAG TPA: helix-turn-helix domain-containing protein [Gemmatimonadales bacterium]|nr:helix-turn-helix domain-containing protein [Gemmatimonadales bacterium]